MMSTITDWLMVIITFVYVIATIFICYANFKSAKASKEELAEMNGGACHHEQIVERWCLSP